MVSRTVRPEPLVLPPNHLPQSPKVGAGRGGGGAGRTVTLRLFWLGGPYCHANVRSLWPFSKGEMQSLFLCVFRVWFSDLCLLFVVLLFLGSLFEINFRERTFVFGCRCWSRVL